MLLALISPYTADSYPVKKQESTMQTDVTTNTRGETPSATVNLTTSHVEPKDWAFLWEWSNRLGVSLEELLKRILIAAIKGQLYVEKIPEI